MGIFDPEIKSLEPSWQARMRRGFTGLTQAPGQERIQRAGEAYPGELTAGMSPMDVIGQQILGGYMTGPTAPESPLFQAGTQELMKTLGGEEYDPFGSAYYQGFRNQVMRELAEGQERLGARTSAADKFFGGGRIKAEEELQAGALNALMERLGSIYESERTRRFGAVPQALGAAEAAEVAPLRQVAAGAQYGLERPLEQARLDAEYREWLRQLGDLGIGLDTFLQLLTYQPAHTVGPSPAGAISGLLGSVASAAGQAGGLGKLFSLG